MMGKVSKNSLCSHSILGGHVKCYDSLLYSLYNLISSNKLTCNLHIARLYSIEESSNSVTSL